MMFLSADTDIATYEFWGDKIRQHTLVHSSFYWLCKHAQLTLLLTVFKMEWKMCLWVCCVVICMLAANCLMKRLGLRVQNKVIVVTCSMLPRLPAVLFSFRERFKEVRVWVSVRAQICLKEHVWSSAVFVTLLLHPEFSVWSEWDETLKPSLQQGFPWGEEVAGYDNISLHFSIKYITLNYVIFKISNCLKNKWGESMFLIECFIPSMVSAVTKLKQCCL